MDTVNPNNDFTAPSIEELQPLFPAYEIVGFIAQGGMGAVYSARQISLDRPVAIKILPRQFSTAPEFRNNFEAEAKAMARLNHTNLIGVYDFGETGGMLYIVMELVEGRSLHESVGGQPIPGARAAVLVSGICHGLADAHKHGILHRDIKPSNILLDQEGRPKIGDFGLARPLGEGLVVDGETIWGTPGYSAPEVVNHPERVDKRTDVFAVGVLLYELLTARLPGVPFQPPSKLVHCHPGFDSIIRRATHPQPEMRYPSASEMAVDIDSLIKKLNKLKSPGVVPVKPIRGKTVAGGVRTVPRSLPHPGASGAKKSNSGPILIGLGVCGLIAALIAVVNSSNDRKERDAEGSGLPTVVETGPQVGAETDPDPASIAGSDEGAESGLPANGEPGEDPTEAASSEMASSETAPPEPEPVAETQLQSLARLSEALKGGDFSEVPEGMVQAGKFRFLLVDEPLAWHSAFVIAESVGAQLAVLDSPAAISWASENFKRETPFWLGLSDSGTETKWHWVSGAPVNQVLWAPGQPGDSSNADDQDFAVLLPGSSVLDDMDGQRPLPFLLQWVEGEEAPGLIVNQLRRLGDQFRARQAPVFPAGSFNVGGSRFLLMPRSMSWEEASAMCVASGGHLAVPSNPAEQAWIASWLSRLLQPGDACWMGGRKTGDQDWTFVTQEAFYFVNWAEGQPEGIGLSQPYLQVRLTEGLPLAYHDAAAVSEGNRFFLMEWSAPSRRNMPGTTGNLPAARWLASYRERFVEDEKGKLEEYRRDSRKVAEDFADDLEDEMAVVKGFNKGLTDSVEEFAESIRRSGELPRELDNRMARRFVGDSLEDALEKQERIREKFALELERAKESYRSGLLPEASNRSKMGDREGTALLNSEHEAASSDSYFQQILEGQSPLPPSSEELF